MKDRRAIIIKNPRLQKIRNNLRDLWFKAVSTEGNKISDEMHKLTHEGIRRAFSDLSPDEQQIYRTYQKERDLLNDLSRRSICMCVSCGKGGRDMVYNRAYDAWYCTECYEMHREYAIELFQLIGKTKPQGHEETAIHELYETFLDYEESHEIELKLVREGILIYLLRFHSSNPQFAHTSTPLFDTPSYTTIKDIQNIIKRPDKAISYVLKSLKEGDMIELINSPDRIKVQIKLTRLGLKEAENALDKIRYIGEYDMFWGEFPSTLEDFNILLGYRSDM